MADYGLHRNSEGYSDPTAAEAIKGMAKPGEIWQYKGREVLIVKNQGGYSNILTLSTAPGKDPTTIEVAGRYATPGKLNYAFNDRLGAMVERITDAEYKMVLHEIETAFKFSLYQETEPAEAEYARAIQEDRIRFLKSENKGLRKKIELMREIYNALLTKYLDGFGDCE